MKKMGNLGHSDFVDSSFVINLFINLHNDDINYSCNVDFDCTMKIVKIDSCNNHKFGCVNSNSSEAIKGYSFWKPVILKLTE